MPYYALCFADKQGKFQEKVQGINFVYALELLTESFGLIAYPLALPGGDK